MKMLKTAMAVSLLALVILATGCGKGSGGAVLAKVNRSGITETDFKRQLGELTPQMQQAVAQDPKARKDFLDDLIGIELVIQEAKRLGLDKDAEFKKSMEAHRKELEDYKKKIEQQLQDAARNELFNSVLKKEIGDKLNKVPAPTDEEIKAYYEKNKALIHTPAGKQLSLKEVEPQLKMRLWQEKRRDIYLDYAKGLKAKAAISVNDKALDAAIASFTQAMSQQSTDLSSMHVTTAPTPPAAK
ncbi:MAG TPA: SurA N-terminal domain-containing protein [Nitrospirota bacterium]